MTNYARLSVTFQRGEGAWLWDDKGKKYLDALAGIAVSTLGHAHPAITAAICDQASKLLHTSNLYGIELQSQLADALCRVAKMDRAFFCNSGAEANEAAIKLARLYGHQRKIKKPTIIVTEDSFHGRTLATLTATGNRKVQAGFEPLVQGFVRAPYDDLDALHMIAENNPDVVAVMVEPILGEGGICIPDANYLNGIRELCDQQDWLMILDEIQTGMCRTGHWFAHQHNGIVPDVMTLAKSLGNGVPIGACLARGTAAEVFQPGNHGSTFGGNPLACRAALAVMDTLGKEHLADRATQLGEHMLAQFKQSLQDVEGIVDIRGKGLMLAIELEQPCGELVGQALDKGLLINVTAEKVVRLLPPLIINDAEADQIVNGVSDLIKGFVS